MSLAPRHAIAAAYAGLFFGIGVYMPYFPVWLSGQGYDAGGIAFALAVPMLVRLAAMPLGGVVADRTGRPRLTLVLYALATAACFAAVALAPGPGLMLAALGLSAVFWQPCLPVLDAYTVARRREGLVDYGRVRLWGSLAFIGGNLAGGFVLSHLPADGAVWLIVAGSLAAASACLLLTEAPLPASSVTRPAAPRLPAALIGGIVAAALIQGAHAVLYALGSVHWRAGGLSDGVIGLLWALGVLSEVVLFRFATRLTAWLGPMRLLLVGAVAGMVRFAAMAAEPSLGLLAGLQVLHAATFGCTYLGTVELVARHAAEGRGAGTQAAAAWATGLAMAGATLLAGPLWTAFGPGAYLLSVAMAGAGGMLALTLAGARQPLRATP
ncbi:MAG TPA: MFS transporter [Xanthobacteraceae bacterium]|nr:MFS transporter [Xanthobacteraceae bacterium]